ncbi:MAG: DEAD/DEAH box helicase [Blastochloris sp.]|nr:DEAD/DEAH box helicase [Blastochloris sp.]
MSFQPLGLSDPIIHAVQRLRYIEPSPIQTQATPILLEGKDLIASAQTGTGKTAAFTLPILSRLAAHQPKTRCLILEPTRELAAQVVECLEDYTFFTDLSFCLVHGGVGYGTQNEKLAKRPDIVVATPGRLLDHLENKTLSLSDIEYLVLDEADRMLDMGFLPDVSRIIRQCPTENRQTMLFSATIPPRLQTLVGWAMKTPETLSIGRSATPAETVRHVLYPVAADQKFELLLAILENLHYESIIVFTRTKMGADRISGTLEQAGHKVVTIHSDRSQAERTQSLASFKDGSVEVLVATDIASRGLDIDDVTHVINYDIPENPEDYVHRIGRTGRASRKGDALTIFTAAELELVQSIERLIGVEIERVKLDHFPYVYTTLLDPKAASRRKPRRR